MSTWTDVPGLAAGERAVVRNAPLVVSNLPVVGGGTPEQIFNASGLWFGGVCPCGDFSGTQQKISDVGVLPEVFGSGGPAMLPWGPTGESTVLSAGKLRTTGASTTVFPVEVDMGTATAGWTYKVAMRRMTEQVIGDAGVGSIVPMAAVWDASDGTFTATGKFGSFIETGDDWVYVSKAELRGTRVGGASFTHSAVNDALTLVAHGLESGDKVVLGFPGTAPGTNISAGVAYYVVNHTVNTIQLAVVKGGWPINLTTPNNAVDVYRLTSGTTGWYRVKFRRGNDVIGLDRIQSDVISTVDLDTCELLVFQSAQAVSMPAMTWDETTKTFTDAATNAYLLGYQPGPDDTVFVRRGYAEADGTGFMETCSKIVSATDDSVTVADGGLGGANNKVDIVVLKRSTVVGAPTCTLSSGKTLFTLAAHCMIDDQPVTVAAKSPAVLPTGISANVVYYVTAAAANTFQLANVPSNQPQTIVGTSAPADVYVLAHNGFLHQEITSWTSTDVTLAAPLSWTPQWLDFYYVYISNTNGDNAEAPLSNPESCPTPTALSSLACFMPYTTPNRHERMSLADHQGHAILPSAASGTLVNHYWFGTFTTQAEAFNAGDELHLIWNPADYQYNGTPFFLEVLLWPNMDPEVDWIKDGSVDNNSRLVTKVVRFQSSPIKTAGIHPIRVELFGKAGGRQTEGADNYSFGWTCRFEIGESGQRGWDAPILTETRGPLSIVTDQDEFDPTTGDVKWQLLIKAEHISLLGKAGYHGYYAGEPFSCTTGNGGSLLHNFGSPVSNALPFGPRFRYSSTGVRRNPAASY